MKTSTSQFLTILECMEKNGDLNKTADGPYGRLKQYEKWSELANVLNTDIRGEAKSVEKWKKVWSDFKNNTKRKAMKIQRSVVGAGGQPLTRCALSDLELRVLNVIGSQAATGLIEVEEADSESPRSVPTPVSTTSFDTKPNLSMINLENSPSIHDTTEQLLAPEVEGFSDAASPRAERDNTMSPSLSRRRRGFRQRSFLRRRTPRTTRVAMRHFLASDERWRNLFSELATEHLRLREREIEQKAQWQALFSRCLDCFESFLK